MGSLTAQSELYQAREAIFLLPVTENPQVRGGGKCGLSMKSLTAQSELYQAREAIFLLPVTETPQVRGGRGGGDECEACP